MPEGASRITRCVRFWQKMVVIACCTVCLAAPVYAQPDWVKDAVVAANTLTIEPDVPAAVVCYDIDGRIKADATVEYRARIATKVLSLAGVPSALLAEEICFGREIDGIKGWRCGKNGTVEALDKGHISIIAPMRTGYYDDRKLVSAGFPETTVGDIVAYEYSVTVTDNWTAAWLSLYLPPGLPVATFTLRLATPPSWTTRSAEINLPGISKSVDNGTLLWSATGVPFQPDEAYTPPARILQRGVLVGCYPPEPRFASIPASWRSASQWDRDHFEEACIVTDSLDLLAQSLCAGATDSMEKLKILGTYVRDQMRYVAVEIGVGGRRPRPASTTAANMFGDCKDKSTLLRTLLKAVAIPSTAVLAAADLNTHDSVPSPFQFNHVITAVPLASLSSSSDSVTATDGYLYIDPTSERTPVGSLPAALRGSRVLPMGEADSALVFLPEDRPEDSRRSYRAVASLQADFSVTADITRTDFGQLANTTRYEIATIPFAEYVDSLREAFADHLTDVRISDFSHGSDADSTWIHFILSGSGLVSQSGDLHFLKADLLNEDAKDRLKRGERTLPVYFGRPSTYTTDIEWHLADGLSFEPNDDSTTQDCGIAFVSSRTVADGREGRLQHTILLRGGCLPPDSYESARAWERARNAIQRVRFVVQ